MTPTLMANRRAETTNAQGHQSGGYDGDRNACQGAGNADSKVGDFSFMIKLPVKSTGKWSRIRFDLKTVDYLRGIEYLNFTGFFLVAKQILPGIPVNAQLRRP